MPDNDLDPGASTQMFRAFVERDEKKTGVEAETGSKRLLIVGVLLAVVAAVVIGFLVL